MTKSFLDEFDELFFEPVKVIDTKGVTNAASKEGSGADDDEYEERVITRRKGKRVGNTFLASEEKGKETGNEEQGKEK